MLEVYTYNAGKGDCIRVRFAQKHNIFIDSGVIRFASLFRQICLDIVASGEVLDALILTHVDDDHIGGILANLRDNSYVCPFAEVWMNHDEVTLIRDANLSTRQNNEVAARLKGRGVPIRRMYRSDHRMLAGASIETIWPEKIASSDSGIALRRDTPLAYYNDYRFSLSHLAQQPIRVHDSSRNNKNSIVFTFSFDSHRLLFTGDAWAEDVVKAEGNYDLIKLPHHGSVRNISEAYQSSIRADNFLICTDGKNHPDKQTIAKLEAWYGRINVYSPAAWWKNGFFVDGDNDHHIHYFQKDGLVIAW